MAVNMVSTGTNSNGQQTFSGTWGRNGRGIATATEVAPGVYDFAYYGPHGKPISVGATTVDPATGVATDDRFNLATGQQHVGFDRTFTPGTSGGFGVSGGSWVG